MAVEYYYYYAALSPSPLLPWREQRATSRIEGRPRRGKGEGRRCAGPGWPRRACAQGGGWRHKGRDRGEKGGWKRRMPVVPSPRYESANSSLLLPGFSRYLLYLSFSISLSLSLSPLSSLSDHSRASVFLASYHRTVPPASRRPRSTINYRISRYVQRSLFLVQNCVVRIVFFCFFFFWHN